MGVPPTYHLSDCGLSPLGDRLELGARPTIGVQDDPFSRAEYSNAA
jgi:hypothetical protein